MYRSLVTLAFLLVWTPIVWAQDEAAEAPAEPAVFDLPPELAPEPAAPTLVGSAGATPGYNIWTTPALTGNWLGARSALREAGIIFAGRSTQFGFGIAGGVNRALPGPLSAFGLQMGNTTAYTGRGEYDTILDLDKLVGLPKGRLLIRFEHWYGQFGNISLNAGTFAPPVFPALLPPAPNDPGTLFLTNFLWTQPLSEHLVVFAGKSDVLGNADQDIFAGGDGTDQFVNQALIANPAFLLGLPYTSFSAGFVSPQEWGAVRFFVRDPTGGTTDYFRFDKLFSEGVIIGSELRLKTNFFDLPGEQHVGGMWKHVPLTNLSFAEPPPGVYPEPTVPGFPTLSDSYTLYYGFDQYVTQYAGTDRGWGLFGRGSISDGNPTPIRYFLSTGLGGYSPIARQRGDTFGLGWYFTGASNEFGPLPRLVFGPRNATGVELFYNFQVTPWLNVTPDLQVIRPGAGAIAETGFVYGVRMNMKL
ncbi:MAG: carbohydrate porin [Planctomycetes bacterium]|nr:carbohydrate porin [Planctomycetota bacterium]